MKLRQIFKSLLYIGQLRNVITAARNSIIGIRDADTVSSFKSKLKTHFFLCALTMFDFY